MKLKNLIFIFAVAGFLVAQSPLPYSGGPGSGGAGSGISGSGTTNTIPKFTGSTAVGNSSCSDNATTVTCTEPIATPAVSTGTSPPIITPGTGGLFGCNEGTAPTGAAAGVDIFYCDSAAHNLLLSVNGGSFAPIGGSGGGCASLTYKTVTAPYTILAADSCHLIVVTGSAGTITVPQAGSTGFANPWSTFLIWSVNFPGFSATPMTLSTTTSVFNPLDMLSGGGTSYNMPSGKMFELVSDGTNWQVPLPNQDCTDNGFAVTCNKPYTIQKVTSVHFIGDSTPSVAAGGAISTTPTLDSGSTDFAMSISIPSTAVTIGTLFTVTWGSSYNSSGPQCSVSQNGGTVAQILGVGHGVPGTATMIVTSSIANASAAAYKFDIICGNGN